jgi:hypothetical protein
MLQRTSQQALDISAIVPLTVQASIVIGTRMQPRAMSLVGQNRLPSSLLTELSWASGVPQKAD